MFGPHLLGDAVGAQRSDVAADVDAGLVDRVAECLAGVAADHQPAGLRHERAHVADVAAHHDVDALHRNTAPRSGIALDHQQAAVGGGARRLRRVALDPDRAAHHVLGHAGACVAVDDDLGLLVHARGVVADMALDSHLHRCVDADGDVVRAVGVCDHELTGQIRRVQRGVDLAQRCRLQSKDLPDNVAVIVSMRRPPPVPAPRSWRSRRREALRARGIRCPSRPSRRSRR